MWGPNTLLESSGLVLLPVGGKSGVYHRMGYFVVALEYNVN